MVAPDSAPERRAWDRLAGEPSRAHEAFRTYRDLGPLRQLGDVEGSPLRTVQRWSARWSWVARAVAWDDEVHRADDARRLEAIRAMHSEHQQAGRAATAKALEALALLPAEDVPASAAARLLELGTRLERDMLLSSVEQLQGQSAPDAEDPWERIARELEPADDAD